MPSRFIRIYANCDVAIDSLSRGEHKHTLIIRVCSTEMESSIGIQTAKEWMDFIAMNLLNCIWLFSLLMQTHTFLSNMHVFCPVRCRFQTPELRYITMWNVCSLSTGYYPMRKSENERCSFRLRHFWCSMFCSHVFLCLYGKRIVRFLFTKFHRNQINSITTH